jgi:chromosomal replication initiator protein
LKKLILWGDGRMNTDIVWSNLLNELKDELSSLAYDTWFNDTKLYKLENGVATIIVPMPIHKRHLYEYYGEIITSKLNKISGSNYELKFYLQEEIEDDDKVIIIDENIDKDSEYNNSYIKENENINNNLMKKFTFDNFVVGNSNKFAATAALSVAENPGKIYNPFFLYGNSGLGKTHLMHAIGNYIVEHSNKKVLYITSEEFKDEIRKTYKKDENGSNFNYIEFFKNKYRNIDVLIIDDIQLLGGASKSQEQLFHTFNTLFNNNKQIIVSSDRSPNDLKLLEDRLRTRFTAGLNVNIYPPDFNLKKEILIKKIKAGDFEGDIPEDVIEYIANNIGPDVRSLEGAVTRLIAYSAIWGAKDITLDLAIDALPDYVTKGMGEKNNIQRIQRIVAEYFQISVEDIRSKKRNANISNPRQIAMYLCRTMTDESFPRIGIEFGGKDHSTVMHSVEKIEKEIRANKDLANQIEKLKKDISAV